MPKFIWATIITLSVCKGPHSTFSLHYSSLRFLDPGLDNSMSVLRAKADLSKLKTASEALYDSCAEGGLARCLDGTRTQLLLKIMEWTKDVRGKRISWLCGKAGIGKSTICRTIASELEDNGQLGASFFFKRGRADRSHAKLFFPTVAKQLADKLPKLGHAIAAALEADSLLCERHMTKQFEKMLLQPLQSLSLRETLLKDCFLVVDALDECEDANEIETLLKLLEKIEHVTTVRVRLLVTSRPDPIPTFCFAEMARHLHDGMELERAQVQSVKADLRIFFVHELNEIKRGVRARNPFGSLPANWATQSDLDLLVDKSHPLFIVAFTLCKVLALSNKPQADLRMLLSQTNSHGLSTGLEAIYLPVLQQAIAGPDKRAVERKAASFREVIGSLVLLYDPLSATALSSLLNVSIGNVGAFIPPLKSVLNVAETVDGMIDPLGTIKIFHLSFRDFLLDPDLVEDDGRKQFWIDEALVHGRLKDHCLRLLSNGALREDVCYVGAPGTLRASIDRTEVASHLPEGIAYACCYWVQHASSGGGTVNDQDIVYHFLKEHMLHWIEALSWLGKASDVIHKLATLRSIVDVSHNQSSNSAIYSLLADSPIMARSYWAS